MSSNNPKSKFNGKAKENAFPEKGKNIQFIPIEEDGENWEIAEDITEEKIDALFKDARDKLERIEAHANQQKKQIVVWLAKNLEDKIQTDTICIKIVTRLHGQVSEGFVRGCLDEQYKQKHLEKNARKQKKKQDFMEEKEDIDKSAEVTPLNQELENDKIVLVGTHGQELVQREGDSNDKRVSDTDGDDNSNKDNTESSSAKLTNQKEHEQQSGPNDEPVTLKECPGCRELYHENIELREVIEKQNQFTPADKMKNGLNNHVKTVNKILVFEFCKPYWEISEYVDTFSQFDSSVDVWFSGKIDTSTGMVVSSGYGRIRQHQKQGRITSENIAEDDWEVVK